MTSINVNLGDAFLLQIQQGGIVSKRLPKVHKNALRKFLGIS